MNIDPTAPRRPWFASTNRIVFLLICVVSASIASVICLITCVMIYALNNIDVNIGAPISIVISLLTFIVTIVLLVRRRRYLRSPDWLVRITKEQQQAAFKAAAEAAKEAAARKEWQAAQAAAQEAQQAAFAKETAARKEWQATQSGTETRQAAANTWSLQKSSAILDKPPNAVMTRSAISVVAKAVMAVVIIGVIIVSFSRNEVSFEAKYFSLANVALVLLCLIGIAIVAFYLLYAVIVVFVVGVIFLLLVLASGGVHPTRIASPVFDTFAGGECSPRQHVYAKTEGARLVLWRDGTAKEADAEGRAVDSVGHFLDDQGNFVDVDGKPAICDDDGHAVNPPPPTDPIDGERCMYKWPPKCCHLEKLPGGSMFSLRDNCGVLRSLRSVNGVPYYSLPDGRESRSPYRYEP